MAPFHVGLIEVIQRPTKRPESLPQEPSRIELPAGHRKFPNARPLSVPTIFEQDQIVVLRDGTRIRADIFRPKVGHAVPAVLMWGPYGKSGTGVLNLDKMPLRAGIPLSRLSGYEFFEGLDPAEWVPRGYAIVNIDPRGVGDSEGDLRWWGIAEGKDGYDAIEEIAKLPWCNGKVSMAGNAWLAISQWFIAAENPPHLACIAPFEGASDLLRENLCRGGIPSPAFASIIQSIFIGRGEQEDVVAMLKEYPLANEYWEDKRACMSGITAPAYIVASYSTVIHTIGSIRGFQEISHKNKWLAVHATQEWYDLYSEERTNDLQRFFDFYMKDIDSGWMQTPAVRLSVLHFNRPATTNMSFADLPWLLNHASSRRLFLTAANTLAHHASGKAESTSYQADAKPSSGELHFYYVFPEKTIITGPSNVVIYVSSPESQDLDIYVQLRKADKEGQLLQMVNIPLQDLGVSTPNEVPTVNSLKYFGPQGMLRASRRHVSEQLSGRPMQTLSHAKDEPLIPGEIAKLELQIWPTSIAFEPGEQLVMCISGHNMAPPEFEHMPPVPSNNKGYHNVHMGAGHESYLEIFCL